MAPHVNKYRICITFFLFFFFLYYFFFMVEFFEVVCTDKGV